jgi:Tfp pilus assembly PilM family ATPase
MLRLLKPSSTPPISIEVGAASIKMLQLGRTESSLKVIAAHQVAIPERVKGDPDARVAFAAETMRSALRSGKFLGRQVIAAVPKELLHYKSHRLAPIAPEDVLAAAKIDARELFRFDPDSADVQCIDGGEIRVGVDYAREIVLIAAGKQYLNQFVIALHDAGARLVSLDIDPCAAWRAVSTFQPDNEHARVLLDIGESQTRLTIGVGSQIRNVKTIPVAGEQLRSAIGRALGLSAVEVDQLRQRAATMGEGARKTLADSTRHVTELLAREVLSTVRYHASTFGGPNVKRIDLVGGEAGCAQIRSSLAAKLLLPVRPVNLFHGIDITALPTTSASPHLGEWAVVLGLGLKGSLVTATSASLRATHVSCTVATQALPERTSELTTAVKP